jgi:Fe-S cluster assembly protein SufD
MINLLTQPGMEELKLQAKQSFEAMGLPISRMESWKYSPLKTLLPPLELFPSGWQNSSAVSFQSSFSSLWIHIHNGRLISISPSLHHAKGIKIRPLQEVSEEEIFSNFSQALQYSKDPMFCLAVANWGPGFVLETDLEFKAEEAIHIHYSTDAPAVLSSGISLFRLAKGSKIDVLESQEATAEGAFNYASCMILEPGSCMNYTLLNNQNGLTGIRHMHASLLSEAYLGMHSIAVQAQLLRINMKVELLGQHARTDLNGLYRADQKQHIDHQLEIRHLVPHCPSNQLFKGILGGEATGVFNGKIYVAKDAQKTNAFQNSKAMLLSEEARVYSKPELEIFADDVKCSHGAAIGQLNREELFYLMARGIPQEDAMHLLLNAYAAGIIEKIAPESVRNHVREQLFGATAGS